MNLEGSMLHVANEISGIQHEWPLHSRHATVSSHHHVYREKKSFQLRPLHLSFHSPSFSTFFRGRIVSRLASSPAITRAHSSRCRDESVRSTFQLLRQIPPGATGTPVIASSKLRYVWILVYMKERGRKGCKSTRESESISCKRELKCQGTDGSLLLA